MTSLAKAVITIRKEAMVNSMCSAGKLITVVASDILMKRFIGNFTFFPRTYTAIANQGPG